MLGTFLRLWREGELTGVREAVQQESGGGGRESRNRTEAGIDARKQGTAGGRALTIDTNRHPRILYFGPECGWPARLALPSKQ